MNNPIDETEIKGSFTDIYNAQVDEIAGLKQTLNEALEVIRYYSEEPKIKTGNTTYCALKFMQNLDKKGRK